MRFIWFWTFWYWSKEGFRSGSLLRGPLDGIGGHWDEWFRHEASEEDRRAIQDAGRTESSQRRFISWLGRHWARDAGWRENRLVPRYVLRQLARLAPFDTWSALQAYRRRSRVGLGVSAIVLAEDSPGETGDVRSMEAVALPVDSEAGQPSIVPEGFKVDESELDTVLGASHSVLRGNGLLVFLALWVLTGRRPYPRPMGIALGLGWLAVGGLFIHLIIGPEPGGRLVPLLVALCCAWSCLVATSSLVAGKESFAAWRQGRSLSRLLGRSRVRLRMDSALTVKGGSAGLAFCLNTLGSLYSALPGRARRSWLWMRFFRAMRSEAKTWAATGVLTAGARIKQVVMGPKLRACLQHPGIERILTPRQAGTGRRVIARLAGALAPVARQRILPPLPRRRERLGFAAERGRLRARRCLHVAQSIMAIGRFSSRWQLALNSFAILVSSIMLLALPDLWCILWPPPAPAVVGPSSPSPYHLWVNLETRSPHRFHAVLESEFWSNRRVEVVPYKGGRPGGRAEIRLNRLARPASHDEENGTVWIERRQRFLSRELAPAERVGRYSFAYLNHLGHE